jgi:hypothetical protein
VGEEDVDALVVFEEDRQPRVVWTGMMCLCRVAVKRVYDRMCM